MRRRIRDWQLFLAVHAAFVALCMMPLLLRTHLLAGLEFTYPLFQLYTPRTLLSGTALLNALNLNGFPTFIGVDYYSMNPFTYFFTAFLPHFDSLHWFVFANMVAGGVCCSLLLRRLGFSREASVIGGTGYVTGSWLLVVTSQFVALMPVLPLLGFVLLASPKHPVKAGIAGTLLCVFTWWAIFLQIGFMIFAAYAAGGILLAWRLHSDRKKMLRVLAVLAASMIISTIVVLPKLLILKIYGDLSWRAAGVPGGEATSQGIALFSPVKYLFPYAAFPFLHFGGDVLMLYVGTFGFIFLLAGIIVNLRRRSPAAMRFWIAGYALLFLISVNHSPFAAIIHAFPPFSFFRGAGRWMLLGTFAAAPIIASGCDALLSGSAERLRAGASIIIGASAGALCAGCIVIQSMLALFPRQMILLFQRYFTAFHDSLRLEPPVSYYTAFVERRIGELATHPFFLQPRTLFPLLSLIVLAIALQSKPWRAIRRRQWVLVLCALATSASVLFWYNEYVPRGAFPAKVQTVSFLQTHPGLAIGILSEQASIAAFKHKLSDKDQTEWNLEHLVPNTNLYNGVAILDYFDNLPSRRSTALASWSGAHWAGEHWILGSDPYRIAAVPGTLEEKLAAFAKRKDLMNIEGLRYIVSAFPIRGSARSSKR